MLKFVMRKIALLFLSLLILSLCYTNQFGDNFHEVKKAKFYRSRQLNPKDLSNIIQDHRIKLVLNLRGESDQEWFLKEKEATQKAGAQHESIGMSSTHLPEASTLEMILDRFHEGPYPMLVHCQGGADRSGLVSALYLIVVEKKSLDEALSQLDLRFGHIPVGARTAMNDFFELYRQSSRGQNIEEWIRKDYKRKIP